MAKTLLALAADAVAASLRNDVETRFSELVEQVTAESSIDEATAKAAILRLNSEGQIEITPDWTVRLLARDRVAKAA